MDRPEPRLNPREVELFKKRLDWLTQPEGLLDGVIARAKTIASSRKLLEEIFATDPKKVSLGPDDLVYWHRRIFRVDAAGAGRFRTDNDPSIAFGVPVFDEKADRLVPLLVSICPPAEIAGRLTGAFERFHAEAAEARINVERAALAVAELQTTVITMHPFVDGNSRVTNVLTQAALHFLDQPEFLWGPKDWELELAYSYASRPDEKQSIEPLAGLIARRISR